MYHLLCACQSTTPHVGTEKQRPCPTPRRLAPPPNPTLGNTLASFPSWPYLGHFLFVAATQTVGSAETKLMRPPATFIPWSASRRASGYSAHRHVCITTLAYKGVRAARLDWPSMAATNRLPLWSDQYLLLLLVDHAASASASALLDCASRYLSPYNRVPLQGLKEQQPLSSPFRRRLRGLGYRPGPLGVLSVPVRPLYTHSSNMNLDGVTHKNIVHGRSMAR